MRYFSLILCFLVVNAQLNGGITKTAGKLPPTQSSPGPQVPAKGDASGGSSKATSGETLSSGENVVIESGKTLQLSPTSNVTFGNLTIKGTLVCPEDSTSETVIEIKAKNIVIDGGEFRCGNSITTRTNTTAPSKSTSGNSSSSAFQGRLKILMVGDAPHMRVINGGKLILTGKSDKESWSRILDTAKKGAKSIVVPKSTKWAVGDEIAIAPTDFAFDSYENFKIVEAKAGALPDSMELFLDGQLNHTHNGQDMEVNGRKLIMSAEVALLTRSIQIYGDEALFESKKVGATLTIVGNSTGHLDNIEMRFAGHFDVFGRYPIHYHNMLESKNQYVTRSSIFKTLNRCIAIICTDNVLIEDNTCVDHVGHGFFLGAGVETANILRRNLGVTTRPGSGVLMPSDKPLDDRFGPSTYWTTNANNEFVDNVAAGSSWFGFSFEFNDKVFAKQMETVCPERKMKSVQENKDASLGKFEGGVLHSTMSSGLWIGDLYGPKELAVFKNVQAYKVGNMGNFASCFYSHGSGIHLKNVTCSDFVRALWLVYETLLTDSLFVGLSNNTGDPTTAIEKQAQRTLPRDDRQIVGHSVYDGPSALFNVHFANFNPSPESGITASHFDIFGGGHSATRNTLANISFSNPDSPVFRKSDGVASLLDLDGSVSGVKGAYIFDSKSASKGEFLYEPPGPLYKGVKCKPMNEKNSHITVCEDMPHTAFLYYKLKAPADSDTLKVTDMSNPTLVQSYSMRPAHKSFEVMVKMNNEYKLEFNGKLGGGDCVELFSRAGVKGEMFYYAMPNAGSFKEVRDMGVLYKTSESMSALKQSKKGTFFVEGDTLHLAIPTSLKSILPDAKGENLNLESSGLVNVCF